MKRTIKIVLAFVLAVLVGFGVVYFLKMQSREKESVSGSETTTQLPATSTPGARVITSEENSTLASELVEDTANPVAPELVVSSARVSLSVGRTSYFYTVSGIRVNGNSEGITYTMTDSFGHRYTSNNGTFNKVEPNSTGAYTVIAQDSTSGMSSETKTIRGFNTVEPVQNKLTASDLTSMISTGDYDGNKPKLDGKLAKKVSIYSSSSDYSRSTIQEVFMSAGLEGWDVTVTSLEYNCLGQVMGVNLNAKK